MVAIHLPGDPSPWASASGTCGLRKKLSLALEGLVYEGFHFPGDFGFLLK